MQINGIGETKAESLLEAVQEAIVARDAASDSDEEPVTSEPAENESEAEDKSKKEEELPTETEIENQPNASSEDV